MVVLITFFIEFSGSFWSYSKWNRELKFVKCFLFCFVLFFLGRIMVVGIEFKNKSTNILNIIEFFNFLLHTKVDSRAKSILINEFFNFPSFTKFDWCSNLSELVELNYLTFKLRTKPLPSTMWSQGESQCFIDTNMLKLERYPSIIILYFFIFNSIQFHTSIISINIYFFVSVPFIQNIIWLVGCILSWIRDLKFLVRWSELSQLKSYQLYP